MDNEEYAKMVMKEAKSREILVGDCGPSPIEDIPVIEPDNSLFMRKYAELEKKQEQNIYDAFNIPEEYIEKLNEDRKTLTGGIANFMSPVDSPTATEEAINHMAHRIDTQRYAYMQMFGVKNNKEEDNMGEEMWGLYQVIAVDKEDKSKVTPNIDKKVIAKNTEHAKGLAGVNDLLEKYNYDNTKLAVRVSNILDIRPVKDDE